MNRRAADVRRASPARWPVGKAACQGTGRKGEGRLYVGGRCSPRRQTHGGRRTSLSPARRASAGDSSAGPRQIYRRPIGRGWRGSDDRRSDRKSVVEGKSVSVRVDIGGRSIIKKKNKFDLDSRNREIQIEART